MQAELAKRMMRILDASFDGFDRTYAIATLLDPSVAWLLDDDVKLIAKEAVWQMVRSTTTNIFGTWRTIPLHFYCAYTQATNFTLIICIHLLYF